MAIDGLIIVDSTGYLQFLSFVLRAKTLSSRPIIQSGFRSTSTAYPLLHIDALNNALNKSPRTGDVDPVIYVPPYNTDSPTACCHLRRGDIRFLCPVSGDGPSLSALRPQPSPLIVHYAQWTLYSLLRSCRHS